MGLFDIVPNLLSSVITILFPIFASYKALRTSDPAQLTPWLMYWVVFSCFSLVESWTWFILAWLPFYSSLRLLLLCYLVLPQTQGAKLIYQTHIHPFLAHHEHDIDNLIVSAHNRARSAGLIYLKRVVEFVKENLLGIQPKATPQTPSFQVGNYTQNLLSRFNLPSAREGLAAPAGDFYGLLTAALGTVNVDSGTSNREEQVQDLSRSGTLIPSGMTSASEKMTFLSTQRENLRILLSALDKEADGLGSEATIEREVEKRMAGDQLGEGLRKSKSEAEFEEIGKDDLNGAGAKPRASNWMPWTWAAKGESGGNFERGKTSGVDAGT